MNTEEQVQLDMGTESKKSFGDGQPPLGRFGATRSQLQRAYLLHDIQEAEAMAVEFAACLQDALEVEAGWLKLLGGEQPEPEPPTVFKPLDQVLLDARTQREKTNVAR